MEIETLTVREFKRTALTDTFLKALALAQEYLTSIPMEKLTENDQKAFHELSTLQQRIEQHELDVRLTSRE